MRKQGRLSGRYFLRAGWLGHLVFTGVWTCAVSGIATRWAMRVIPGLLDVRSIGVFVELQTWMVGAMWRGDCTSWRQNHSAVCVHPQCGLRASLRRRLGYFLGRYYGRVLACMADLHDTADLTPDRGSQSSHINQYTPARKQQGYSCKFVVILACYRDPDPARRSISRRIDILPNCNTTHPKYAVFEDAGLLILVTSGHLICMPKVGVVVEEKPGNPKDVYYRLLHVGFVSFICGYGGLSGVCVVGARTGVDEAVFGGFQWYQASAGCAAENGTGINTTTRSKPASESQSKES